MAGDFLIQGPDEFAISAVGESNYVAALLRAAGASRRDDQVEQIVDVSIGCEPSNPYDANAVVLTSAKGRKLGYLCREDAEDYCDALGGLEARRGSLLCLARIGGSVVDGGWRIGLTLDLPEPDELDDL
jgi:hypothetical protein